MREILMMFPLSPVRACAISCKRMSGHLEMDLVRDHLSRDQYRRNGDVFPGRARNSTPSGRSIRIERLHLAWDESGCSQRVRSACHPQPHFMRRRPPGREILSVDGIDADQVETQFVELAR